MPLILHRIDGESYRLREANERAPRKRLTVESKYDDTFLAGGCRSQLQLIDLYREQQGFDGINPPDPDDNQPF